jgi:glycosyltransferase involved in cell wall biosynthesis
MKSFFKRSDKKVELSRILSLSNVRELWRQKSCHSIPLLGLTMVSRTQFEPEQRNPSVSEVRVGGKTRKSLFMNGASSVSYSLYIPTRATFVCYIALMPDTKKKYEQRVAFRVEVLDERGGRKVTRQKLINPSRFNRHPKWIKFRLGLGRLANRQARISLSAYGPEGTDLEGAPAIWGDPGVSSRISLAHLTSLGKRALRAHGVLGIVKKIASRTSPIVRDARLQWPSVGVRFVLVLGHWLPAMDQSAGGLRTYNIFQILREQGYSVVFGADREKLEHVWLFGSKDQLTKYEVQFERLNIRVLYGSKAILRDLHEKGYEYRFVVLSYPEVAYRYFCYVRAYAINAKVIYDPVDLHWLRMERESGIKNDYLLRQQSENYRQMERFNATAADMVFAVTQEEKSQILKDVNDAKVEVIPTIHDCIDKVNPLTGRKNLLFVAHYAHSPNEDAVSYFVKEIFPLIRQDLPGVVFYMVGSHMTDTVRALASQDVVAAGYVPDLTPYFEGCRVFVAPLRYGAGIKGKIAQSAGLGLPVVTTSIGAEGMDLIDGRHVLIADSPAAFASAVVRLYTDDRLWEDISQNGLLHIKSNFSKAVVQTKLARIFATEVDEVHSSIIEGV